jgi:UDP-2,3-diacylglucosamine pyrophosphatase LpxH
MTRATAAGPRWRTAFLSDVHLGYRGCQAEFLLAFLERLDVEQLVLVGDIVDLWSLRRRMYWPVSHHDVLRALLRIARGGTRVVFVPGNHDEGFRELCGASIEGIDVRRDFIHVGADGRRYLVVHGDEFDGAVKFEGWLRVIGEHLYDGILLASHGLQAVRRRFGYGYWSLATWLKAQVPDARRYIDRYERAAAHAARRVGLDGVICGHIHRPGIRTVDDVLYCNDGDWVEHCSVLLEDWSGQLTLQYCAGSAEGADDVAVPRDLPAAA